MEATKGLEVVALVYVAIMLILVFDYAKKNGFKNEK